MRVLLWCMGGVALSDFLCSLEKRYRGAVILESRQTRWYVDTMGYNSTVV